MARELGPSPSISKMEQLVVSLQVRLWQDDDKGGNLELST